MELLIGHMYYYGLGNVQSHLRGSNTSCMDKGRQVHRQIIH